MLYNINIQRSMRNSWEANNVANRHLTEYIELKTKLDTVKLLKCLVLDRRRQLAMASDEHHPL